MSYVCCFAVLLSVTLVLVITSSFCEADEHCRQQVFRQVSKGDSLIINVMASYNVGSWMDCGHYCLQKATCVAFNYRPTKKSDDPNCQLSNSTDGSEENSHQSTSGDWIFFKVLNVPSPSCFNNLCQNGGQCIAEPCQPGGFSCRCGIEYEGKLCDAKQVFQSCKEAFDSSSDKRNGIYKIETNTSSGYTKVHCQMTSLAGCSGGGWTMVMKVNGSKSTFIYSSAYWNNTQSYNPAGGLTAFDDQETKLPIYWSTSFKELCIGMKAGNDLNFVSISLPASSLYSLITDGRYRSTNIGRQKWKSLISNSSLQVNCNREGFNIIPRNSRKVHLRLGIVGNNENDCRSPNSFIGLGGGIYETQCSFQTSSNVGGNYASCGADNGNKNTKAMGYVLVR